MASVKCCIKLTHGSTTRTQMTQIVTDFPDPDFHLANRQMKHKLEISNPDFHVFYFPIHLMCFLSGILNLGSFS